MINEYNISTGQLAAAIEEMSTATASSSCQVCESQGALTPSKYRCPRCGVRTCSNSCVQVHKVANDCNGVRNRAAAVRKADYGEEELMSDYTLLEETNRAVDAAARQFSKELGGRPGQPLPEHSKHGIFGKRRRTLIETVRKRKMRIGFMPPGMQRHRENTTTVKRLKKADGSCFEPALFWRIELFFASPNNLEENEKVIVESCPEDQTVSVLMNGALKTLQKRLKLKSSENSESRCIPNCYSDLFAPSLIAFLELEQFIGLMRPDASSKTDLKRNLPEYRQLRGDSSIKDALHGAYIIEFPRLHIVSKGSSAEESILVKSERQGAKSHIAESGQSRESESEAVLRGQETNIETPVVASPKRILAAANELEDGEVVE